MTNDHGDDFQGTLKANFSSNVWYGADNKALYDHLSTVLIKTARYPEPNAESLQALLAKTHNLNPTQITIGNGSIDIIYRIAQTYQRKKSIIVSPTFSEYSKACSINQHTLKLCRLENLSIEIDKFQPDLVWLCNPNNPNGTCLERKELQAIFYTYPQVTFIVDQSFIDFTMQETLPATSILEFSNLILIYSLTKRFSVPGLRIGYAIAPESIIKQSDNYKIPWSVNTLAIEAAKFILSQKDDSFDLKAWLTETVRFQSEIDKIGCFKTRPTQTPFFLVKLINGNATDLKAFLLKEGILIRNATNFKNNGVEMIRLNTLSKDQNNLLISKLKAWNYNLSR